MFIIIHQNRGFSTMRHQPQKNFRHALRLLAAMLSPFFVSAQSGLQIREAFPGLADFSAPIELTHANDGTNRIFVAEQAGVVRVFPNDTAVTAAQRSVFLDIRDRVTVGGERGFLGLAFHPDYQRNGYFYVNYTRNTDRLRTIVSRFSVNAANPNQADPASELVVLQFAQPDNNHNGGKVVFGKDGLLYIATGDGGGGGDPQDNGQNLNTLLGKILRIDVNRTNGTVPYAIPADNPFVNQANARPEIFAYGLRNPWRISVDNLTGRIWAADVGQNAREEIDIIVKGGNYGWRLREGKACYDPANNCPVQNLTEPVWDYTHASGAGRSVTGGVVYRGSLLPTLRGKYIYGDYVSGNIWSLAYDSASGTATNEFVLRLTGALSAFGEDQNQEMYLLNHQSGRIQKFKDPNMVTANENFISQKSEIKFFPNPAQNYLRFSVSLPQAARLNLRLYDLRGNLVRTLLKNEKVNAGSQPYTFETGNLPAGTYIYRLESPAFGQSGKVQIVR